MYEISEAFVSIRAFMEQGGDVLWGIAFLVLFMWTMIFERVFYYAQGYNEYINGLVQKWESREDKTSWYALQIREKYMSQAKVEINRNLSLIQTCVAVAPLFGLLGTVT
jgi:biopolymer transport protein ExbB